MVPASAWHLVRTFLLHSNMAEGITWRDVPAQISLLPLPPSPLLLLLLVKLLIPSYLSKLMSSSNHNYLPKSLLPNTIKLWIWGLNFQRTNFWGNTFKYKHFLMIKFCLRRTTSRPSTSSHWASHYYSVWSLKSLGLRLTPIREKPFVELHRGKWEINWHKHIFNCQVSKMRHESPERVKVMGKNGR